MIRHTWESAGAAAIAVVQAATGFEELAVVVLVRDLAGHVRVVWKPRTGATGPDPSAVAGQLEEALGSWFSPPILTTSSTRGDVRRVAQELVEAGHPLPDAPPKDPRTGAALTVSASWRVVSRRLAKESWLSSELGGPPWALDPGAPPIVSFHSFKGGVGRTTALAMTARHLAASGRRVVCVDLDLEAPGLDRVLGASGDGGVIDFLAEFAATGRAEVEPLVVPVEVHGVEFELLPAGWIDRAYVEKLGRIDLLGADGGAPPVEHALRAMVGALRGRGADYILIDSRSGLSDLAGVSVASLPHVDVLVTRGGHQGAIGLRVTAEMVAPRRRTDDHRLIVAHAMAPLPLDGAASQEEQRAVRAAAWDAFAGSFYARAGEAPAVEDRGAAHFPVVLPDLDEVRRAESLVRLQTSTLQNEHYVELARRVAELSAPESGG